MTNFTRNFSQVLHPLLLIDTSCVHVETCQCIILAILSSNTSLLREVDISSLKTVGHPMFIFYVLI
ncbi:hypothetical protein CW304_08370 [Bacillus sp. UFRGS-B20]|nr:hypothetical protein CW304_08370 [Bacillus sp. UFRGS-B20]